MVAWQGPPRPAPNSSPPTNIDSGSTPPARSSSSTPSTASCASRCSSFSPPPRPTAPSKRSTPTSSSPPTPPIARDESVLEALGACAKTWKSPEVIEFLLNRLANLDDAYRAEWVLRAAGSTAPVSLSEKREGRLGSRPRRCRRSPLGLVETGQALLEGKQDGRGASRGACSRPSTSPPSRTGKAPSTPTTPNGAETSSFARPTFAPSTLPFASTPPDRWARFSRGSIAM